MAVRDFLVFRLVGPMAAWGDIAVGERRGTWDVPAKSAILGLLAAGLGIDRADRTAHEALDRGLGFAVRQDRPGRLLRDYHTAQAPKARKNARWSTRRDELNDDDLNT
ncbi:MAG TPA: type I-E CRISPR-associated protein Cas5/CasD, partial [Rhodospirillum rubrum]|nr:type I-E CRISPR-associated protein Cas5/CasD [Rhodospirillum rubrum]